MSFVVLGLGSIEHAVWWKLCSNSASTDTAGDETSKHDYKLDYSI